MSNRSKEFMISVARMYYLDRLGQSEIADIVGVPRSTVSRLLTAARESGLVKITVADYDPRDRDLEDRLRERFDLRRAIVIKRLGRTAKNVRRSVGYFAAPAVAEVLTSNMTIGVAGGRTLAELIGFMEANDRVRNVSVVQLMGNIGATASSIDALELCRVLAERYGGTFYTLNAPAYVQDARARDVLLAHEHIRLIWRLFDSLQLAFVGIGSLEDSAFVARGVFSPSEVAQLREQGVVGEICGRFFDERGNECSTSFGERVISVGLETLRRVPEVIAVTAGVHRVPAVRSAITGRLVNSLVIDDATAEALLSPANEVE